MIPHENAAAASTRSKRRETAGADKLLEHYLRFVIREESGPLRQRLLNALVLRGLKASQRDHAMTADDVATRIGKLTGLPAYPQEIVIETLNLLVSRRDVERGLSGSRAKVLYRLSDRKFDDIDLALEHAEAQDTTFRKTVLHSVEESAGALSSDDAGLVEQAFHGFVARLLVQFGERCAKNLVEQGAWNPKDAEGVHEILHDALAGLPERLRSRARTAFIDTLESPDPDVGAYLYSAGQAFYMIGLLHLDPELQALQRTRLEETTLFLDTNLLLAALLPGHRFHDAASALVRVCCDVGLTCCYSRETADELERLLDAADREYRAHPPFDLASAATLAPLVDNPFIASWLAAWPDNQHSWNQFRAWVRRWPSVLEHMRLERSDEPEMLALDTHRVERLRKTLMRRTTPNPRGTHGARAQRRPRRPRAAEHDAQMLLTVSELAKVETAAHPFGGRYWFITLDRQLAETARSEFSSGDECPCMIAEEWIHYIAPFASPDISKRDGPDVFAKLLASRVFLSAAGVLSLEDLQPFTAPNVNEIIRGLPLEDACRLVAEAHTRSVTDASGRSATAPLEKLISLVETQIHRQRERGELFTADEVRSERAANTATAAAAKAALAEKASEIEGLKADLAAAERYRTSSLRYRAESAAMAAAFAEAAVMQWLRSHPFRAGALAVAVGVATVIIVFGLGGVIWTVMSAAVFLVSVLALDTRAVRRNLARLFGPRRSQ